MDWIPDQVGDDKGEALMKNKVTKLVAMSYNEGKLDEKTVETIADKLDRKQLKEYIRLLKQEEDKNLVYVTSARELTQEARDMLKKRFPNKMLFYVIDPTIISGIRIIEQDNEYEISLNQTFNDIIGYLADYD